MKYQAPHLLYFPHMKNQSNDLSRGLSKNNLTAAFTLIELLVVIAVIGVLASVILASLNSARAKARDARRKSDLRQVVTALELYRDSVGTYAVTGTGANGSGQGWFSYENPADNYPKSVARGLVDAGVIGGLVISPSGAITDPGAYMIMANVNDYTIWTNLENPSASDIATQNTCRFSDFDNYHSSWAVSDRTNYCVSN